MIPQLVITEIKPENLHSVWEFVERGLKDILRTTNRHSKVADWLPADVFASLRAAASTLYVVHRGPRLLGFFVLVNQKLPYSGTPQLFVWCTWALPFKERLPQDNVLEALAYSRDFILSLARQLRVETVTFISSRGDKRYWKAMGFTKLYSVYGIKVE